MHTGSNLEAHILKNVAWSDVFKWPKSGMIKAWIHVSMTTVYPSLDVWVQQDVTKFNNQIASTVTTSQSNRAHVECRGTGDSHHECSHHVNTTISADFFQHLADSYSQRMKALLMAKEHPACCQCGAHLHLIETICHLMLQHLGDNNQASYEDIQLCNEYVG